MTYTKMNGKRLKRAVLSWILSLAMVFGMLPAQSMIVKADGEAAELWSPDMQTKIATYATLQEAFTAAETEGQFAGVKLLKDVTVAEDLTLNQDINLFLNGHTLTIAEGGALAYSEACTIIGGPTIDLWSNTSSGAGGSIVSNGSITPNMEIYSEDVSVSIEGGKFGGNLMVWDGTLNISGGTLGNIQTWGTVNMTGGSVNFFGPESGVSTISGGTIGGIDMMNNDGSPTLDIKGNVTITEELLLEYYGGDDYCGIANVAISEAPQIARIGFNIMKFGDGEDTGEGNWGSLTITGGYFGNDPCAILADLEETKTNHLNISIAEMEEYKAQTDWAADTETYKYRIVGTSGGSQQPAIAATVTDYVGVYDGQAHGISISVTDPEKGYTIRYGTEADVYDKTEAPTYTNAGTYTIYYEITADDYTAKTGSATVQIDARSIEGATVTLSEAQLVYTGAEQNVTVTNVQLADDLSLGKDDFEVSGITATELGTYTVTVTGRGNFTGTASAEWSIVKAFAAVAKAPAARTRLVENGEEQALVSAGEGVTGGTLYYALGDDATEAPEFGGTTDAEDAWETAVPTAEDAGTYYVWYMVAGDENHTSTTPVCIIVTVREADVKLYAIRVTGNVKVTDSTGAAVTSAKEGDEIAITWTPRADYAFVKWILTGATPADEMAASTTFVMGAEDVMVSYEEKFTAQDEVMEERPSDADTTTKVAGVKFTRAKLTLNKNGSAVENIAVVKTAAGTEQPKLYYVTENADIVAVNQSGQFYPVSEGETTVTAYCGNKKAVCKVTVVCYTDSIAIMDASGEDVTGETVELQGGEQTFLKVSFQPYDSTDSRVVTWKSDNKSVTVKNGIVTAREVAAETTAVITASVKATNPDTGKVAALSRTMTVRVTPVTVEKASAADKTHKLALKKKTLKLTTEEDKNTATLGIIVTPKNKNLTIEDGDFEIVSCESTNENVVTVDDFTDLEKSGKNGIAEVTFTAESAGTAYIIVTSRSSESEDAVNVQRCKVTVTSPATAVSIQSGTLTIEDEAEQKTLTMRKGESGTVEVVLDPEFSTDCGKVKLSGSGGITVKNGVITAKKITKKPAKLTVKCGKLKEEVLVTVVK